MGMGKAGGADQGCVLVWWCSYLQLNISFTHKIKRNDSQSNVTRPNNSNVLTGSVIGIFYEEKQILRWYVEKPLSYWLVVTFLPEKQHLSPAAEPGCHPPLFCCRSYCLWKLVFKNHHDGQSSWLRIQWTFPLKTASLLTRERVRLHPVYWLRLCNYEQKT